MEMSGECQESAERGENRETDDSYISGLDSCPCQAGHCREAPVVRFGEGDSFGSGHGTCQARQASMETAQGRDCMGTAWGRDRGW